MAFEEDAARTFVTEVLNVEGVQPEEWRRCDLGERWQMLGTCAQLYCEGFGLENVVLEVDLDLAPGMYGSCQDEGDVTLVTVGGWVLELDHPKEALETLFHELRHAYQFQYVAAAVSAQGQGETNFDLATAAHWQQAMHTYSQRLHTYVNSSIEHDADRHAKDLLNQIYVR
ncbi:hypothetical protein [Deinococcus aestuarii]|uniref:hypothetical protein n=1 Tax=Deinococcus aestuarii TaxID=2774531 RepID=UPI001C0E4617|nr:hypothetical protein [Deinococcus aestuarii]